MTRQPATAFLDVATLIDRPDDTTASADPVAADDTAASAEPVASGGPAPAPAPAAAARPASDRFIDAATIMDRPPVVPSAPAPSGRASAPSSPGRLRFLDAGTIQERLDDEESLLARLERDPSDPMAGDALEALYARRGDHEAVVSLLVDRAEAAEDPSQRADFLLRAARVYRNELDDHDAARLVLVTALAAAPRDARVHEELDAVVCASGEFAAARAAYADAACAIEHDDRRLAGELWLRVASLHIMERSAPAAVTAALTRIDELDPERAAPVLSMCERMAGDLMVLDALVALYHRLEDHEGAARVLAMSIEHAPDAQDRAGRHHVIAGLASARGDDLEAEWHLAEALRLAPGRAGTRAALADLYRRRGEPRKAARVLEDARRLAINPVDRANLACKAAEIYAEELGERTAAVNLYEIVLANDPERADAAAPLAERYWQRGCYAQLEPLIEVLVRRAADSGDEHAIAELTYRAGKTALELGKHERALDHLRASLAEAPYRIEALRAAAAAASALGRHDEAYEHLTAALAAEERAGASDQRLADTLVALAGAAEAGGDRTAAVKLFCAALGRVPAHDKALAGAGAILRARGDHEALDEILAAAAAASEGERRVRLLAEQAALHARGLADPAGAIELYREALALAPDDRAVLTGLAELYSAAEAWREAVDVLTTLAELEPAGLRRGRYLQIAAQLARGRLRDDETATLFARALDCYFGDGQPPEAQRDLCMRAFSDLEALLRDRRAFKALERAYRTMIKRLPQGAPELPELWSRLGSLYREELDQPAAAIQSYEIAAALDADRATRHRVLIDLYEGFAPDELDKLIERRRRLLAAEPLDPEHYRALYTLHRRAKRRDRAFLALRALVALGAASPDEQERVARLEAARPLWPRGPLSSDQHARIRHADEDVRVTAILAATAEAIAADLAVPPRKVKLRDDPSPGWHPLRELHHAAAHIIGVAPPPLMVCPELDAEVLLANLTVNGRATLSIAVGGRMAGITRAQALHAMARTIAHVRPAYFLRLLLAEPGALDAALDAGLMVGGYRGHLAPGPAAHQFAAALDRRISPAFRSHLGKLVRAIDEPREQLSVERWALAVDATCRRLALLVGGDLTAAIAALGREPSHGVRRSSQERLADLLVHSCSDEHARVRAELGLAVG